MFSMAVFVMAIGAMPPTGTYRLDRDQTMLLVQLRPDKSRLLSGLSHKHVVRALRPTGEVRFDPADPTACTIQVDAKVDDLQVDAPDMRKLAGYDDVLDADERQDIKENMLAKDQLYGKRYPDIRFEGKDCQPMTDGRLRVQGTLTVRGKAHAMTLPMDVAYEKNILRAHTEFTLTHAAFGFEPYSAALGALANDDWLKFTVEVVARRRVPRRKRRAEPSAPATAPAAKTSTAADEAPAKPNGQGASN